MSKRVSTYLDRGLYAGYGDGCVASAWLDIGAAAQQVEDWGDPNLGEYVLQYGRENMPPFGAKRFHTEQELIQAMREVEPDLRKWKLCEG